MLATLHCTDHILLADKEQHLMRQCGFLYAYGEQCRVPVLDVMSTIAVCYQHQDAVSLIAENILCVFFIRITFLARSPAHRSSKAKETNSNLSQANEQGPNDPSSEEELQEWKEEAAGSSNETSCSRTSSNDDHPSE